MKLNHPGLYWVRDSCMSMKVKLYMTDHHSALGMWQNAISVFYLKIVFFYPGSVAMTPEVTIRCQRMSTYPNGPWICVEIDIFVFYGKCSFDPGSVLLNPEVYLWPQRVMVDHHRPYKGLENLYFRVSERNVPLTPEMFFWHGTNKQTNLFNFFVWPSLQSRE